MKQNIADLVEEHILNLLHHEKSGVIEIQRGDVANAMSCAPSQVTYVLSTRFTHERGFVVESRRGLGGFIRITIIPLKKIVFEKLLQNFDENSPIEDVKKILRELYKIGYISRREAEIVLQSANGLFASKTISKEERLGIFKRIFDTLEHL